MKLLVLLHLVSMFLSLYSFCRIWRTMLFVPIRNCLTDSLWFPKNDEIWYNFSIRHRPLIGAGVCIFPMIRNIWGGWCHQKLHRWYPWKKNRHWDDSYKPMRQRSLYSVCFCHQIRYNPHQEFVFGWYFHQNPEYSYRTLNICHPKHHKMESGLSCC